VPTGGVVPTCGASAVAVEDGGIIFTGDRWLAMAVMSSAGECTIDVPSLAAAARRGLTTTEASRSKGVN